MNDDGYPAASSRLKAAAPRWRRSAMPACSVPITSLDLKIAKQNTVAQDPERPEKAEHLVRVEWIKTVSATDAVRKKGLFGNQNSAARPIAKNWRDNVDRLKMRSEMTE